MILIYIICPRVTSRRILTYRIRTNLSLVLFSAILVSRETVVVDISFVFFVLIWIIISVRYIDLNRKIEEKVYKQREAGILQKYKWLDFNYRQVRAFDKLSIDEKRKLEQLKNNAIAEINRYEQYKRCKRDEKRKGA